MKNLQLLLLFLAFPLTHFAQGVINTIGGTGAMGYTGDGGQATAAQIQEPRRAVVDAAGNIYFVHQAGNRVRKISATGIITTVAGNGTAGFSGDGGPATAAQLKVPSDVVADSAGNLYIADLQNYRIRKVDAATGIISTVAGDGQNANTGNGGQATAASIFIPYALTLDHEDNLYIAGNSFVRKISPDGVITAVCGLGGNTSSGDGGPAINADVNIVLSMCVDSDNNLYLLGGARVRKIDMTTGIINTIAGNGNYSYSGDGNPATSATIAAEDIKMDRDNNLYLADGSNNRIRKITPEGIISTVAGTGAVGSAGDGGAPLQCSMNRPDGIGVDTCGYLYIAEHNTHRIRKVTYDSCMSAVSVMNVPPTNISFYPNPASNTLHVTSDIRIDKVDIYDAVGKVAIARTHNNKTVVMDVSSLSSGIYFVAIVSGGTKKVEKLVIRQGGL